MNEGIDFCDLVGRLRPASLSATLPSPPPLHRYPSCTFLLISPSEPRCAFLVLLFLLPSGAVFASINLPSFLREKAADCDMAGKIELTLALSRTRWTVVSTRVRFECIPSCLGFISTRQHFQSHLTFLKPSAHAVREKYSERVLSY